VPVADSLVGLDAPIGAEERAALLPTPRELEVLRALAAGWTDAEAAARMGVSPATVQTHVRNAKAKLGARTRAQAVAMAIARELIATR
jgi:DNA-binding NarL/FixJ family response regulator